MKVSDSDASEDERQRSLDKTEQALSNSSSRSSRCAACGKRLALLFFDCGECGQRFCSKHRRGVQAAIYCQRSDCDPKKASGHLCSVDWAAEQRRLLGKQMNRSAGDKRRQHGLAETV